jgi:drug/metabolite transporter (DMT)-like permease
MRADYWALAALILALFSLALGVVRRLTAKAAPTGSPPVYVLIPLGIIIGVLPRILVLNEAASIAASVASLIMSLTAIVLLLVARMKA